MMRIDWTKYDGVLFDLDGTLIDSMHVWEQVVRAIYEASGIDSSVPEDMKRYHAMKVSEVFTYIRKRWQTAMDEDAMQKIADSILLEQYTYHIQPVPGAISFVKTCREKGKKLAVVTSSPMVLVEPVLKRLGIWDDFDGIASAEDQKLSKREPEIFTRTLDALGMSAQRTLYFEDSRYALETADRLGITGIGMKTETEPYLDRAAIEDFCEVR